VEEVSDLKIFSECFRGPLETLWRATFGPQAAIYPPMSKMLLLTNLTKREYPRWIRNRAKYRH